MPFVPFLVPVMAGVVAAGPAGWQLKASVTGPNTGGSTFTLGPINTVGADLIVIGSSGAPGAAPTDSAGNAWTAGPTGSGNGAVATWYTYNAITSSSHTFTIANSYYQSAAVLAYSGSLKTSAVLDRSSTSTTNQPGSITPTTSNQLIVAMYALTASNPPYTINQGFTIEKQTDYAAGVGYGTVAADLIQTAAAAVNPTLLPSASVSGSVIASFKHG